MMQVFLGDNVSLLKEMAGDISVCISGQVSGVVLDDKKQLERIWLHGMDTGFWMSQGWKFVEERDDDEI